MKNIYQRLLIILCIQLSINLFSPVSLLADEVILSDDPIEADGEGDDSSEDESDDTSDDSSDDVSDDANDDSSDDSSDDTNEDSGHSSDDSSNDDANDSSDDSESSNDDGEVFIIPTPSAPTGGRVKVEISRSISGELKVEIDVRGLPVGTYDLSVGGTIRGSINVVEQGDSTRGGAEYETIPDDASERFLDFDILGQLVEISQAGILYFSGIAPSVSTTDDGDLVEIETSVEDGSTELETYIPATEQAPQSSAVKVKVEHQYDGELAFEVEIKGLPVGDYDLLVGGVNRGVITMVDAGLITSGEVSYESSPDDSSERLLDFPVAGENISIEQNGVVYFSGIIPIPVKTPSLFVSINNSTQSVSTALLPDPLAVVLSNGWKESSWFGVYDDSRFPMIEHCSLGFVEYRFTGERNFLVSDKYGVLEIFAVNSGSGSYGYFSFETGRTFTLSPTDSGCTSLNPGVFYDEGSEAYVEGVVPAADDVLGFYNIAFDATRETQEKSALTIQLIQAGNIEGAVEKLLEAAFYRNLTVNNANRAINAAYLDGNHIEFWESAALNLIATADEALINAQTIVAGAL
jgi:hypothetical protein